MQQVAAGVTQLQIQRFVNVYFVETLTPGEWVLVDTGLPGSAASIIAAADELFYPGSHPEAIILTHGHLDHIGAAKELAAHWHVPVVVHPLEMPFVTGRATYPPPDPTVGGSLGFVTRFFPAEVPNIRDVVMPLPPDSHEPPYLPGWRWLHVPGHAPGQIALFREDDRTLLGADAFATVCHDSIPAVLLGMPKISRGGTPYVYDWDADLRSVQLLAALEPLAIGCGHGPVIKGPEAAAGLHALANNFPIPAHGRYVTESARTDAGGVLYVPPAAPDTLPRQAAIIGAGVALGLGALLMLSSRHKTNGKATRKTPKRSRYGGLTLAEGEMPDYPYKEVRF